MDQCTETGSTSSCMLFSHFILFYIYGCDQKRFLFSYIGLFIICGAHCDSETAVQKQPDKLML